MKLKPVIFIFLLLIVFGIAIRIYALDRPYSAEEIDFVRAGEAIANTGHPLIYVAEQKPAELALWHPPMYIFLMAATLDVFSNEFGARIVNILFSLLLIFLVYYFCKRVMKKNGKEIGIISAAIFSITYYIIQSSIIIDIDVLAAFFIFSFIFSTILAEKTKNNKFFILAAISLFFSLFNRFQIAGICFLATGIFLFVKKTDKKFIKKYMLSGILSGLLFLLVWGAYSSFIEPGNFFSFIKHNAQLGAEQFASLKIYLLSFMLNISQLIRLVTLPAIVLFLLSFFYLRKKNESWAGLLLLNSALIVLLFLLIPRPAFGYGRYFLSAFAMLSIIAGYFIFHNLKGLNKKNGLILAIGVILSILLIFILQPKPVEYTSTGLIKATSLPEIVISLLIFLPSILALFAKKNQRRILFVYLSLAIFIIISSYLALQFSLDTPGTREAGEYIQSVSAPSDLIIAPGAVGYYSQRRFYANDYYKPEISKISSSYLKEYFVKSLQNRNMDEQFFWGEDIYSGVNFDNRTVALEDISKAKYLVVSYRIDDREYQKKFGEFYIYKLN